MSVSAIGWIVSIIFIAILVIGFFIGFWRGLKRSTASLILGIVGIILAFFITPVVTNAILGINISVNGQSTTINNFLINYFREINQDTQLIANNNPNFETLLAKLPSAVGNVIVFILLTIVVEIIVYIIYKIIALIFLKYKDGQKKHRLTGGVVGAVKTLIILVFAFMPLSSLIGLLNGMMNEQNYFIQTSSESTIKNDIDSSEKNMNYEDYGISLQNSQTENEQSEDETDVLDDNEQSQEENVQTNGHNLLGDQLPSSVKNIIRGLENNALIKVSKVFGLDNYIFDYYSTINIDGQKVKLREEIANSYSLADFVYQIQTYYNQNNTIDFASLDFEKIEKVLNKIVDGNLFESVIAPVITEIISNYEEYSFMQGINSDYKLILNDLKDNLLELKSNEEKYQYISNDIKNLFSTFKILAKSEMINSFISSNSINETLQILTNEKNKTSTQKAFESLFSMNMIQDSISSVVKLAFEQILGEEVSDIDDSSQLTQEQWTDLSVSITQILENINNINNSLSGGIENLIKNPEILFDQESETLQNLMSELGLMIDRIKNIKLFQITTQTGTGSIIDNVLSKYNLDLPSTTVISVSEGESGELVHNEVSIQNYQELFNFISPVLITVKDTDIYNIITSNDDINVMLQKIADKFGVLGQDGVEGDKYILHKIILPLYQIDFTNELIVKQLQNALPSDSIITFAEISNFEEWENELDYISDLLVKLNTTIVNVGTSEQPLEKSYFSIILSGDYNEFINNLKEEDVDGIFRPILLAKSTDNLKKSILNIISENISKITNKKTEIASDNIENQVDEIISIIKSFISLNKALSSPDITIENLVENSTEILGNVLNTIKKTIFDESGNIDENAIFGQVFEDVVDEVKTKYSQIIENNTEISEKLKDLKNADFRVILEMIADASK